MRFPRATHLVCAFEKEEDAQRFYHALGERLKKFNLELSVEKTHVLPFSPSGQIGCAAFDFLGFEFRWGKDRAGKPHVNKRTARKSLKNSLQRVKLWCKENKHLRLPILFRLLNTKLTGYYNHYGVHGNSPMGRLQATPGPLLPRETAHRPAPKT